MSACVNISQVANLSFLFLFDKNHPLHLHLFHASPHARNMLLQARGYTHTREVTRYANARTDGAAETRREEAAN